MAENLDTPQHAPRYDKRLAIIVPYRDRAEHLGKFIPHMVAYFERDKLDRNISYSIHVVEQLGDEKLNRGKLKNCGFKISEVEADYFCFHDVDYLPIWADYSYCDRPTRLIWHGLFPRYQYPKFFGAVVLFNKGDFVKVNGYSNAYWGWGFNDEELRERCPLAGLSIGARDGTYTAQAHNNAHFNADGSMTAKGEANKALYEERMKHLRELYSLDGVNTLEYRLAQSSNLTVNSRKHDNIFHHKVEI